jgi:hypothetical protein
VITGFIGALLSLGPGLHIARVISHAGEMPYAKLVQVFPGLDFSGVPVRFGLMAQGALVIAASLGLAWLLPKLPAAIPPALATAVVTLIVLAEFWPQPLPTSVWAVPPPMLEWANSPEDFAVLDMTGDTRMLWNALHHGKRCVGGYVTRAPKRLDDWWDQNPVFPKINQKPTTLKLRLTRDDPAIDFNWGEGSPSPEVFADFFAASWDGSFDVSAEGTYQFDLAADDQGRLQIDGADVARVSGRAGTNSGSVHLAQGVHQLHVDYQEGTGNAAISLGWQGPNLPNQILRPVSDTAGAPPAFHAHYSDARVESGVSRAEAVKMLQDIKLRYIAVNVRGDARDPLLEGDLGLTCIWFGDGIRIYEVPKA